VNRDRSVGSPGRRDGVAAILVYHRIADVEVDPFGLCVRPERFDAQLEALREIGRIVHLRELAVDVTNGELAGPVVALTFDDGYADNLDVAAPLLERHRVPATVFVVTDNAEDGATFWWDELTALVLGPPTAVRPIRVTISGAEYEWTPDDVTGAGEDLRGWRAWEAPPGPRARAYRELWGLLQPLDPGARDVVLDQLRSQLGDEARTADRPLGSDELVELTRSGLVEVGAHTGSHPRLADLSLPDQEREIVRSKRWLEEVLGSEVRSFSYPYGLAENYGPETVSIVRRAGFRYACAVALEPVTPNSSPLELPRLPVEDWEPAELAARISSLFGR